MKQKSYLEGESNPGAGSLEAYDRSRQGGNFNNEMNITPKQGLRRHFDQSGGKPSVVNQNYIEPAMHRRDNSNQNVSAAAGTKPTSSYILPKKSGQKQEKKQSPKNFIR